MDDQPDDLTTVTTFEGDAAIIAVVGELDVATSDTLTRAVHDAAADGARWIVLDLSRVEFMDSSGISALLASRSLASITLRRPSPAITRLIDVTGLTDVFAVEP